MVFPAGFEEMIPYMGLYQKGKPESTDPEGAAR